VRRRPGAPVDSRVVRPVAKIADVAAAAQVSAATVSRVLNGSGAVSPERAERVIKAAADLGYQPFGPARALRQQRTRVWAVIIADIENPFFTSMVRGIEDVAREHGHQIVLCNSDEDVAKEAAYLEVAISERMAGVVIAVASTKASRLDTLLERDTPVVAVDRVPASRAGAINSVVVDNRLGAALATDHLLSIGCKRIACITGPTRLSTASDRLAGYREALQRAKVPFDAALVRRADFRQEGGHEAALDLFGGRKRPDALFVANNLMTLGALAALRELGLGVPDDVSVIGFDDAPWAELTAPPLTVVAQPTYRIGTEAARLLASAREDASTRQVVLPPSLVVRESTLPLDPSADHRSTSRR
jgi:LacI family transcriptional regulator